MNHTPERTPTTPPQQNFKQLLQSRNLPLPEQPLPLDHPSYPQQQTAHPQQSPSYPQQQAAHPQQSSSYPQQQTAHPQQSSYPQQQTAHPQQSPSYPQQQAAHPPQNAPVPMANPAYPPQNAPVPMANPAYPPQTAPIPPQNHLPPQESPSVATKQPSHTPSPKIGLLQAGSILSFWAEAADLLLTTDHGDAALLYLHILRKGHGFPELWDQMRTAKAQKVLESIGMYDASQCANPAPPVHDPIPSNNAPNYSRKDLVLRCQEKGNGFSQLLDRAQKQMRAPLTTPQQQTLLELFEHVGLQPNIITMLIQWVISRYEEEAGEGQLPSFALIKKEGYRWNKMGITTVQQVDAYMIEEGKLSVWEGKVLSALHIYSRKLTSNEKEVCEQWYQWGITEELLTYAYEKHVEQIGNFSWPYLRKMVRSWHEKGLKTVKEVKLYDNNFSSRPKHQKEGYHKGGTTKSGPRIGQPSETANATPKIDKQSNQDMALLLRSMEHYDQNQPQNNNQNNQ